MSDARSVSHEGKKTNATRARAGFLPGAFWTMFSYTLILITVNVLFFWPPGVPREDFEGDVPGLEDGLFDEGGDGFDTAAQLARIRETVPPDERERDNPLPVNDEILRQGRALYASNCSTCHGQNGDADVPIAGSLNPPPVNFTHPSFAEIEPGVSFWVIANGVPGSGMPPFASLFSEEEMWSLVHFIRETFAFREATMGSSPNRGVAEATAESFHGLAWSPPTRAPDFTLMDHAGNTFRLQDERGSVVVLFFGYTHCPDVCPMTLDYYAEVEGLLGSAAADVRFVFVTVDPERDTPKRLQEYLANFSPTFVGLWGTDEQVAAVVNDYQMFVDIKKPSPGAVHYDVEHTSFGLVIDRAGQLRVAHGLGADPQEMADDLLYLLRERSTLYPGAALR